MTFLIERRSLFEDETMPDVKAYKLLTNHVSASYLNEPPLTPKAMQGAASPALLGKSNLPSWKNCRPPSQTSILHSRLLSMSQRGIPIKQLFTPDLL
jgi:hypothetical protein